MIIQKYHITMVCKSTGEVFLDITTKDVDLGSVSPFAAFMERYVNILRLHPSVYLSIEPIRTDIQQLSLF